MPTQSTYFNKDDDDHDAKEVLGNHLSERSWNVPPPDEEPSNIRISESFYDNTDSMKVIITPEELILRKVLDKGSLYYLKNLLNIQIPGPYIQ